VEPVLVTFEGRSKLQKHDGVQARPLRNVMMLLLFRSAQIQLNNAAIHTKSGTGYPTFDSDVMAVGNKK
jgi:hypothetical protein